MSLERLAYYHFCYFCCHPTAALMPLSCYPYHDPYSEPCYHPTATITSTLITKYFEDC